MIRCDNQLLLGILILGSDYNIYVPEDYRDQELVGWNILVLQLKLEANLYTYVLNVPSMCLRLMWLRGQFYQSHNSICCDWKNCNQLKQASHYRQWKTYQRSLLCSGMPTYADFSFSYHNKSSRDVETHLPCRIQTRNS